MQAFALAVGLAIIFGSATVARYQPHTAPAQPIPFSHRFHVSGKHLNCFFCHPSPTYSMNAGMPSVDKCLLCHNVIASNFEPISKIREYANRGKGIPWVRVNRVPDFVHFSHQAHLAKGFDCGVCHGDVSHMDRITPMHNNFDMDFCISCHWKNKAPDSCFTCHY